MTRRCAPALLLASAGLSLAAAPAWAAPQFDFRFALTSTAPGTPTGLSLRLAARGEGKPPPLRSAVYAAPAGIRFDTGAATECHASDDELHALGAQACPPESRLTIGAFEAMTGFGPPIDPLHGEAHVFNGPGQIIEVLTVPGTSIAPAFDRVTISGSTLTAHPPVAPGGPPEGETSPRSLEFAFGAVVNGGRSLITAPPACPESGVWTTRVRLGFGDGTTATAVSATPCDRGGPSAPAPGDPAPAGTRGTPPGVRLTVRPRRVRAGRRSRLAFRLVSADPRCRSGLTIRLRGRRIRTDARGRARWTGTLRRAGRARPTVATAHCGRADAVLRVVRR